MNRPTAEGLEFLAERQLATLTTMRADGTPHVTPVGFTHDLDEGLAWVICSGTSQKAVNIGRRPAVALCQLDRARWITLEGTAVVLGEAAHVAAAEERYARRYRTPRPNPARVALQITVSRLLGSASLISRD